METVVRKIQKDIIREKLKAGFDSIFDKHREHCTDDSTIDGIMFYETNIHMHEDEILNILSERIVSLWDPPSQK